MKGYDLLAVDVDDVDSYKDTGKERRNSWFNLRLILTSTSGDIERKKNCSPFEVH
jgi:hypothetical protein